MSLILRNLLVPFRRDKKRDFAVGTAEALLASKVRQALLTEGDTPRSSGELPWRTAFGGTLALLRHRNNDATLRELARVYVEDALRRWVPSARIRRLDIIEDGAAITLRASVDEGGTTATVVQSLND